MVTRWIDCGKGVINTACIEHIEKMHDAIVLHLISGKSITIVDAVMRTNIWNVIATDIIPMTNADNLFRRSQ